MFIDPGQEETVKYEVFRFAAVLGPGFKCLGYVIEEHGLDDAAGTEYGCNLAKVQVPSVLQRRILHQRESLGVGNDFSRIQGFPDHGCKLLLVRGRAHSRGVNQTKSLFPGVQMIGHDTCAARGSNHGNIHALLQGLYAGPSSGAFLFGAVQYMVNQFPIRQVVRFPEDVSRNANQVAVQFPLVPGMEDISQFPVGKPSHIF